MLREQKIVVLVSYVYEDGVPPVDPDWLGDPGKPFTERDALRSWVDESVREGNFVVVDSSVGNPIPIDEYEERCDICWMPIKKFSHEFGCPNIKK